MEDKTSGNLTVNKQIKFTGVTVTFAAITLVSLVRLLFVIFSIGEDGPYYPHYSSQTCLQRAADQATRAVEERIARFAMIPYENSEDMQVKGSTPFY